LATKLNEALARFSVDTLYWAGIIYSFRQKLEFLFDTTRYNKLLSNLLAQEKMDQFKCYVFEVLFAYDFESKGHKLDYEVKQLSKAQSLIDFCYNLDNYKKLYFELRLINQRNKISESIELQLKNSDFFEISLDGEDEKNEIARLQSLILSKCQGKDGNPIKFYDVRKGIYNIIVAYVSELKLGMIDRYDCLLAMYGDPAVASVYRRNVVGLYQKLPQNVPSYAKKYCDKFEHFRQAIHGVLFVKNRNGRNNRRYIDLDLEYLLVGNINLLKKQELDLIDGKLSSFLEKWTNNN